MADEYIKREKAIGMAISGRIRALPTTEDGEDWIRVEEVRESLQIIPAADVVPVVRCKDCKWWKLSDYNTLGIHICQRYSGVRGEHDFCSRDERR